MNKVILIGNITKDVEVRQTQSGKLTCDFNIAINNGKDQQGNELPADFIGCKAWNNTVDILQRYAPKGTKVCIEGRVKVQSWDDNQGNKQYRTYVLVDRIELLSKPQQQNQQGQYQQAPQPTPQYEQQGLNGSNRDVTGFSYTDIKSDDLPFY